MIIAIDIDEVLCDSITPILDFYNTNYNGNLSMQDLSRFVYLGFLGNTKEEAGKKLLHYNSTDGHLKSNPIDGAKEAVDILSKKHELKIITSRPYYIKDETVTWLNQHFPNKFNEIIFNNTDNRNSHKPGNGRQKSEILNEIGAEVLIEDMLNYAIDCPNHIKVFLIDKPWNQGDTPKNVARVNSWSEIIKELD